MNTYHITTEVYEAMAERAQKYATCYWDCIELADGHAVTFGLNRGKPYDVEVRNEDDEVISHDFSVSEFERLTTENNAVCYDLMGRAWICGNRVNG